MSYTTNVMISRAHYILVSIYYPHSTHDALYLEAEKAYMGGTYEEIHRKFIYMNVYSKQFSVISAVEDAIEYVRRWRYVYETNDLWSPLFLSVVWCLHNEFQVFLIIDIEVYFSIISNIFVGLSTIASCIHSNYWKEVHFSVFFIRFRVLWNLSFRIKLIKYNFPGHIYILTPYQNHSIISFLGNIALTVLTINHIGKRSFCFCSRSYWIASLCYYQHFHDIFVYIMKHPIFIFEFGG